MREKIQSIWMGILVRIAVFVASVGFVFTFLFGVWICDSRDMYPAVREGDLVVYCRKISLARQDAVVYENDGEVRIGRIAATTGEVLGKTGDGKLTIDGRIQPVQPRQGIYGETRVTRRFTENAIPSGKFFLLGDAREEATDSRKEGLIPENHIRGKVFMLWRRRGI